MGSPAPALSATSSGLPRIAIIGGGIAGLSAAYDLTRDGAIGVSHQAVVLYEAGPQLGGLAAGFKGRPEWEWPLEHFYHHLFTNDDAIFGLTAELGLSELLEIHRPTTVMHFQGRNYPFDSPLRLLQFPHLSTVAKLRMGLVLAYLRYHPRPPWRRFDRQGADGWLRRAMGDGGYEALWRPMLQGKFGPHFDEVNLAWFWARVYKRTPRLGYFRGGFQAFIDRLAAKVRDQGATILTGAPIKTVRLDPGGGFLVDVAGEAPAHFDAVVSTVSPQQMVRLVPELPTDYLGQLRWLKSMGAVVLTVALDRPLMHSTYWVNVPKQEGIPFLALVEHTNMIDSSHYAGDHLLYLGDYLDPDHRYFEMRADELLDEFAPHLARFNPEFRREWVTGAWVHKARYAQPVPPVGYAAMIPALRTPLPGLYFASMSQVYPWDRGTNYAVELGRRVAQMVLSDMRERAISVASAPEPAQVGASGADASMTIGHF